jgi:hypothetical protein
LPAAGLSLLGEDHALVTGEPESNHQVDGGWAWSDAWVLTAACICETDPVKLVQLIEAADYINHAILLDEEINDGLVRLSAAGFVRLDGNDIAVTDQGRRLYEEASAAIHSVLKATDAVNRALNRLDLPSEIPRTIQIPATVLRAAKEQYYDDVPPELRRRDA